MPGNFTFTEIQVRAVSNKAGHWQRTQAVTARDEAKQERGKR